MSVFIYQYKTPHYFADTNNVSESLMQMLRNILVLSESARKTAIFGCIYRAIIISLLQMYKRKELVESVDDEEMYYRDKYNYFCDYIVQEMVHLGYTYEVVSNNYKVLVEKSNKAEKSGLLRMMNGIMNILSTLRSIVAIAYTFSRIKLLAYMQLLYYILINNTIEL